MYVTSTFSSSFLVKMLQFGMGNTKVWSNIIADFFVNLGAGWFGVALIIPTFSESILTMNFGILILDISFGIVSLLSAYLFRK